MNHALLQGQSPDRRGPARLSDAQYRKLCRNMGWEPQPLHVRIWRLVLGHARSVDSSKAFERTVFTTLKD